MVRSNRILLRLLVSGFLDGAEMKTMPQRNKAIRLLKYMDAIKKYCIAIDGITDEVCEFDAANGADEMQTDMWLEANNLSCAIKNELERYSHLADMAAEATQS